MMKMGWRIWRAWRRSTEIMMMNIKGNHMALKYDRRRRRASTTRLGS